MLPERGAGESAECGGVAKRTAYYEDRVEGLCRWSTGRLFADHMVKKPAGAVLRKVELISAFGQIASPEEAARAFDTALYAGVIAERTDGRFEIPVPSMERWLVEQYAGQAH